MGKRDIQKAIRDNGGIIFSDGTLNMEHLLPKAYDWIQHQGLRNVKYGIGDMKETILECFELTQPIPSDGSLVTEVYWGFAKLKEYRHGDIANNPYDVWEECCDYFNSISPAGYYFGSSEGDGALLGWFKYEDEEM